MNSPLEVEKFLNENKPLNAKYVFNLFIIPRKFWSSLSEEDVFNLPLRPILFRRKMISGLFYINIMCEQITLQLVIYLFRVPNGGKRIKIYTFCKDQFSINDFQFYDWLDDFEKYNDLPLGEQNSIFNRLFTLSISETKSNKIKEVNGIYYG